MQVRGRKDTRPTKKPKDLSGCESEEFGYGEGECVYVTLIQSDTVQPYGHGEGGTSPRRVGLSKKTKDLSTSEREECGHGKGVGVYPTL